MADEEGTAYQQYLKDTEDVEGEIESYDVENEGLHKLFEEIKDTIKLDKITRAQKLQRREEIRENIEQEMQDSTHLKRLDVVQLFTKFLEFTDEIEITYRSEINKQNTLILNLLKSSEDKIIEEPPQEESLSKEHKENIIRLIDSYIKLKDDKSDNKRTKQMAIKEQLKKLPKQKKIKKIFEKYTGDNYG